MKRFILIVLTMVLMVSAFAGCARKEELFCDYYSGSEGTVTFEGEVAEKLYAVIDLEKFQSIQPGMDVHESISGLDRVDLEFYTSDDEDLRYSLDAAKGFFQVFENDVVYYSAGISISAIQYYQAPEGTYDALAEILAQEGQI